MAGWSRRGWVNDWNTDDPVWAHGICFANTFQNKSLNTLLNITKVLIRYWDFYFKIHFTKESLQVKHPLTPLGEIECTLLACMSLLVSPECDLCVCVYVCVSVLVCTHLLTYYLPSYMKTKSKEAEKTAVLQVTVAWELSTEIWIPYAMLYDWIERVPNY